MDAFHLMKTVVRAGRSGGADPSPPTSLFPGRISVITLSFPRLRFAVWEGGTAPLTKDWKSSSSHPYESKGSPSSFHRPEERLEPRTEIERKRKRLSFMTCHLWQKDVGRWLLCHHPSVGGERQSYLQTGYSQERGWGLAELWGKSFMLTCVKIFTHLEEGVLR